MPALVLYLLDLYLLLVFLMGFSAQGTIEYLVMMVVIIAVALFIFGLTSSFTNVESYDVKANEVSNVIGSSVGGVTGGIVISDAAIDASGKALLYIKNDGVDPITITSIGTALSRQSAMTSSSRSSFSQFVGGGSGFTFYVSGFAADCACEAGQKNVLCPVVVNYTSSTGLTKSAVIEMLIDCVNNAVPGVPVISNGVGTLAYPWIITTCTQLQDMNSHPDGNYRLGSNVDCSASSSWNGGDGFRPVQNFTGSLDGNGKIITGFYGYRQLNHSDRFLSGALFADLYGSVDSLGMTGVNIRSDAGLYEYFGAIAQINHGTITNSYASGSVGSGGYVGGLVGLNSGTISNSHSSVIIDSWWGEAGGIAGRNESDGSILRSYATGSASGWLGTGGLVGQNYGLISNCYATAYISGKGAQGNNIGGLVGGSTGVIENSYATGPVRGYIGRVGGLAGDSFGRVSNSFSTGDVKLFSRGELPLIGGFIGGTCMGGNYDPITCPLGEVIDSYWYDYPTDGITHCYMRHVNDMGAGIEGDFNADLGCTMESDINYFYNSANPPMSDWNFTDIWQSNTGAFPTLR